MSFAAAPLKRAVAQAPKAIRSFQTSKQSLSSDADHYIHATHMYDVQSIKNRKVKFGIAISGIVAAGMGLPFFAVHWQKLKSAG